jgi:hypothetical protein
MVDGEARRNFGPIRTPSSRRLEVARLGLRRHRKLNRGAIPRAGQGKRNAPLARQPEVFP